MSNTINFIQNFGQISFLQNEINAANAQGGALTEPWEKFGGPDTDFSFDPVSFGSSDSSDVPDAGQLEYDPDKVIAYIFGTVGPGTNAEAAFAKPANQPAGQNFKISNDGNAATIELKGGYTVTASKSEGSQISISDGSGNVLLSNWDPHWHQNGKYVGDSKRDSSVAFGDYKLTKITTFDPSNPNAATYNKGLVLTGANGVAIKLDGIFGSDPITVTTAAQNNRELAYRLDEETNDGPNKIWFNPSSGSKVETEKGYFEYLTAGKLV